MEEIGFWPTTKYTLGSEDLMILGALRDPVVTSCSGFLSRIFGFGVGNFGVYNFF